LADLLYSFETNVALDQMLNIVIFRILATDLGKPQDLGISCFSFIAANQKVILVFPLKIFFSCYILAGMLAYAGRGVHGQQKP
jgi:hypothetical protein